MYATFLATEAGGAENQDRCAVIERPNGLLLIVTDGAGGMGGGAQAAELAVKIIQEASAPSKLEPFIWCDILDQVDSRERMAVCFDTQHAFAAGYDIRTPEDWENTMQQFDRIIGLDQLLVIHLDDSKRDLGTRVDRHAKIGEGVLGLVPFWCLVNDPRFADIPAVLETPVDDESDYGDELKLLRSLIGAPEPKQAEKIE